MNRCNEIENENERFLPNVNEKNENGNECKRELEAAEQQ